MKLFTTKLGLLLAGLLFFGNTSSQTLTCANTCPQEEKVFGIRTASPVIGSGGQNKLWNFSSFSDFGTIAQSYSYASVAAITQASLYPQASIVMKKWNGLIYFMNLANDGIRVAYPSSVTVNAPEVILPFPFSYGTTYTQTIVSSIIESGDTMVTVKNKTITCAGTGTMVLPWKTFNNTVKVETFSTWTMTKNGAPFGYKQCLTEHTFYSTDYKHRVVYYSQRYEDGPADYGPNTELYYEDVTGIDAQENKALQVSILPNPASTQITITQEQEAPAQLRVYSFAGHLLLSEKINSTNAKVDVSTFPRGLYLLVIEQGQSSFTKKIVLQ